MFSTTACHTVKGNSNNHVVSFPFILSLTDVIGETYPNIPTDTGPEVPPIPEASSGYEPSPSDLPETVPSEPSLTQTTPWVDSQDDPEQEATAEETYTGQPGDQEGDSGPSDGLPTQTVPDGEAGVCVTMPFDLLRSS